ncbi:MAG: sugar ABC transporter permease [Chloroflexi bacterium]|nr:sugar ABC transporter permease [Chloroflexota bacterium]
MPWFYLLPALAILTIYVVYPTVRTFYVSLRNEDSSGWAGDTCNDDETCFGVLENYHKVFTEDTAGAKNVTSLYNTARWLVIVVPGTVILGLLFAMITDRVRYTAAAKAIIFMPMAISFVGAALIWGFVYDSDEKVGLLNAFLVRLGFDARNWLGLAPPSGTFLLTVIAVWVWTGFTMTLLAAAIKSIPGEVIEASRVDGANEFQLFFRIILPQIMPTVAVVMTTMTINTLKMFDIVWVMGGRDTDVIATRMVSELTESRDFGMAAAIAVVLILLTIPVMVYNVRRFTIEEARR